MITKTQAIKNFLTAAAPKHFADLYHAGMECQVNVAQDDGERVEGDYKGREWHGWTDGIAVWKPIRIPFKAATEPEYTDGAITWNFDAHVEGIGMTGWDWQAKLSRWVAFDFDSIVNHTAGLRNDELVSLREICSKVPWVSLYKSTSGKGLHLYVFLDPVETNNHTEHAALARAVLGKLSGLTGTDLSAKVDICGGNMWVWHRKMRGTDGLTLVKQGSKLFDLPLNWQEHLTVIKGTRRKVLPQDISAADSFEELSGQFPKVPLDGEHKRLIEHLETVGATWSWHTDHHMLITHTKWLEQAKDALGLRGLFKTNSPGNDLGTPNCFAFPMRRGAWAVRRYSRGVTEHVTWTQDKAGWTRTFLNRDPDLSTAASASNGVEDAKGVFHFREAETAQLVAGQLGARLTYHSSLATRAATLQIHKDGRLFVTIERKDTDTYDDMQGWMSKGKFWQRLITVSVTPNPEPEIGTYDDVVRHQVTTTGDDCGWVISAEGTWKSEPLSHIKLALESMELSRNDVTTILGSSIFKPWTMVNRPFEPEYPGDREWNLHAAQLAFAPSKGEVFQYPSWTRILEHCGTGLDDAISVNPWARANGIISGADYLKCWVASLFQAPTEPLPYLFFYGPQNSGKSIFHEALSLLLTKGYQKADIALTSPSGFNGELEGALLCVVEEVDISKSTIAYNRIKDWVTGRHINIRQMYRQPYHITNTTHWVQAANDPSYCPVFKGDTRITMVFVPEIDPLELIPKRQLIAQLEREAPDFLAEILGIELPESPDRLNVPVISTEEKAIAERLNRSDIQLFFDERCKYLPGGTIKFDELYASFSDWCSSMGTINGYTKIRFGREIPAPFLKGRSTKHAGQVYVGNIVYAGSEEPAGPKLTIKDDFLVPTANTR